MTVVYMNRRDAESDGLICTNSTISICRTCLIVVACALARCSYVSEDSEFLPGYARKCLASSQYGFIDVSMSCPAPGNSVRSDCDSNPRALHLLPGPFMPSVNAT